MIDEREFRVIDLAGVVTPSEFMEGWAAGVKAYLEIPNAANPFSADDFSRSNGWAAGFASVAHAFGEVRRAHGR